LIENRKIAGLTPVVISRFSNVYDCEARRASEPKVDARSAATLGS